MTEQLDIFLHSHENNRESEEHYVSNMERFNSQCKTVLELLLKGIRLTTTNALVNYRIGDLRRRIKDLRDAGVKVEDEFVKDAEGKVTRFKEYFIKPTPTK